MILQADTPTLTTPWRWALVPLAARPALDEQRAAGVTVLEIEGIIVRCMRSFHEEVAADFFFASHYSCDPAAPLTHLDAPVAGEQLVVWWHEVSHMIEGAPEEWQAVMRMFRAAMATLHPQGTYLRLVFPTDAPAALRAALADAFATPTTKAAVGYDYRTHTSHF